MKESIIFLLITVATSWCTAQEQSLIKDVTRYNSYEQGTHVANLGKGQYIIQSNGVCPDLDSLLDEQCQYLYIHNDDLSLIDSMRVEPPYVGFEIYPSFGGLVIDSAGNDKYIDVIVLSFEQQPNSIWIFRYTEDLQPVFKKKLFTAMYSQYSTSLYAEDHLFLGVQNNLRYYTVVKYDKEYNEVARWQTDINRYDEPRGSNFLNHLTLLADGRLLVTLHEEYIKFGTHSFRHSYFLDQDLNCLNDCDDHLIKYTGAQHDRKWNFVGTPDGGIICNTVLDHSAYSAPIGFYRHDKDFNVLNVDSIWNDKIEETDFVWNLVPISGNRYLGMGTSTIFYREDVFRQHPDSFIYYQVRNNALAFVIDEYGKPEWFKYIHNYDTDHGSWLVDGLEMDNGQFLFVGTARKTPEDIDTNPYASDYDTWIMTLDENGCYNGDCSNYMWIEGDSTGNFYPEFDFTNSIRDVPRLDAQVFPNPADDELSISIEDFGSEAKLSLYHVSGAHRKEHIMERSEQKIDISDLPSGAYLLMIQSGEKVYVDKIVIR